MEATRAKPRGPGGRHRSARRRWLVTLAPLPLCLLAGWVALARAPAVYSSSTSILVDSVDGPVNLATESQLVSSTKTATDVAALLTPNSLVAPATVTSLPGTSILIITVEAGTASLAQAGARAYAQAYLANRSDAARTAIADKAAAINRSISDLGASLAKTNARIAVLSANSPELTDLRDNKTKLASQITNLTLQVNLLATSSVDPGRVLQEASRPTTPISPQPTLYFGLSAVVGLVLAVLVRLGQRRWSDRILHSDELSPTIPLLADLPADAAQLIVVAPRGPAGRAFNRLRNEIVASLAEDERAILVTGASPGGASTLVCANLAAALVRADNEVILVGANMPELGSETVALSQLFEIADIPGLTDVLTHRTSMAKALQRAPRWPRLRIVTSGATASAAGLLQSEAVRAALHDLRRQARYLVIEAPSAAAGSDAQSLAGLADVAIIVAEIGQARRTQVDDAAVQLLRMGTRLLGVVVLPRLSLVSEVPSLPSSPAAARRFGDSAAIDRTAADGKAPLGHRRGEPVRVDSPTTVLTALSVSAPPPPPPMR